MMLMLGTSFVEVVAGLSDDLETAMARWSSVMLNSAEEPHAGICR
jgi:hypothetical protein